MSEEEDQSAGVWSWTEGLRRWRELVDQMTAAAQAVAVAGAKATPTALSQPLADYAEQLLAVSAAVTNPLRQLLDEQQRLAAMMSAWADKHHEMSAQIAEWARLQGQLTEQMAELARPLLDQSAILKGLHAEWSGRAADTGRDHSSSH